MSVESPALKTAFAAPVTTPGRRALHWLAVHPGWSRLLVIIALLLLWEIAADLFGDPLFVASPSQVVMALEPMLTTPGIPDALLVTAWELATAFALSAVVGIAFGTWLGLSPFAERSFMPIVLLLYATPQVTIIPIFMIAFGIGPASKIAYGFSHGVFPIIITVTAGVRNINPILLVSSRSMGADGGQILRHVVFPHMIPSLFTGMRLGMTATLLGVILAELYASLTGVGYFSRQFAQAFKPAELFGLIALVAAIAILINETLRRAELRFTVWRKH
jgi:ABC-type nitrate/sulfonate/bicarbonate transport system permease component